MDWAEKYRPAHLADIVGNATAVRQIADWAKNWTRKSETSPDLRQARYRQDLQRMGARK